ncbi:glutathione peroxidase [Planctomycetota bacterium]
MVLSYQCLYDISVQTIEGEEIFLSQYRGKVLLVVNVASRCGFSSQYEGLQNLYLKYREKGFEILAFPTNDFLGQEPGTNEEIRTFCSINYDVTFPLFAKISVQGKEIHPLYRFLTQKNTNPDFGGKITWNFNKFLIDRNGVIIHRFGSFTKPENKKFVKAIEIALQAFV